MANQDGNQPDIHDQLITEPQTQNPNDIKNKRNKTMLDQIREDALSNNPKTSYGRSMVA